MKSTKHPSSARLERRHSRRFSCGPRRLRRHLLGLSRSRRDGNGPAAKNRDAVKPRDFTAPEFRVEGREDELHRLISQGAAKSFHGSEYMLEWENKLSPQQIDDVLRTRDCPRRSVARSQLHGRRSSRPRA